MQYCFAGVLLFAMLPGMNMSAAPVPDPSAILDLSPPPKGKTAEQYCKEEIARLTSPRCFLGMTWCDPEVRNLPSVAPLKEARPWLAQNLRVTEENGGRRLRFTFKAGKRYEQVVILNALFVAILHAEKKHIKFHEDGLRSYENYIPELEKRIESGRFRESVDSYRKGINELRSIRIPERRAEIARLKQFAVVRWAR